MAFDKWSYEEHKRDCGWDDSNRSMFTIMTTFMKSGTFHLSNQKKTQQVAPTTKCKKKKENKSSSLTFSPGINVGNTCKPHHKEKREMFRLRGYTSVANENIQVRFSHDYSAFHLFWSQNHKKINASISNMCLRR